MDIFSRLLVPLSSELPSERVVHRAGMLAEKFGAQVTVIYIIEEKTLKKMEDVSRAFLTEQQRTEVERRVVDTNKMLAEDVIFKQVKPLIRNFDKEVVVGEFSEETVKAAHISDATCIVTGYEKYCLLKYRLLDKLDIPLWIEQETGGPHVLGICSNLAPNKRVPDVTLSLAGALGYTPHLLYVVDTEEKVEVDEYEHKRECTLAELTERAHALLTNYEGRAETHFSSGVLEDEIASHAHRINPDVVIIGKEMKRKRLFCRDLKHDMVAKLHKSLLFLN